MLYKLNFAIICLENHCVTLTDIFKSHAILVELFNILDKRNCTNYASILSLFIKTKTPFSNVPLFLLSVVSNGRLLTYVFWWSKTSHGLLFPGWQLNSTKMNTKFSQYTLHSHDLAYTTCLRSILTTIASNAKHDAV